MTCKGIYALGVPNQPIPDAILSCPWVDAVVLRQTWIDILQKHPTYFHYQSIRAHQAGKRVVICEIPGQWSPVWPWEISGYFTFIRPDGQNAVCPVPWNSGYRRMWEEAQRYVESCVTGSIDHVKIPLLCGMTEEEHLPRTDIDTQNWLNIGYRPDLLVQAYDQWIIAMKAVWPGVPLIGQFVPFGFPPIDDLGNITNNGPQDPTRNAVGLAILARMAQVPGCGVQNNAISPTFHSIVVSQQPSGYIGGQFNKPITGQNTSTPVSDYAASFQQAIAGKCQWIEVYPQDLLNPAFANVNQHYHQVFNQ